MICQIKRNKDRIEDVLTEDGSASELYKNILISIPETFDPQSDKYLNSLKEKGYLKEHDKNIFNLKETALGLWSKAYTPAFLAKFGNSEIEFNDEVRDFIFQSNFYDSQNSSTVFFDTGLDRYFKNVTNLKQLVNNLSKDISNKSIGILKKIISTIPIKIVDYNYTKISEFDGKNVNVGILQAKDVGEDTLLYSLLNSGLHHHIIDVISKVESETYSEEDLKLYHEIYNLRGKYMEILKFRLSKDRYKILEQDPLFSELDKFVDYIFTSETFIYELINLDLIDILANAISKNLSWPRGLDKEDFMSVLLFNNQKFYSEGSSRPKLIKREELLKPKFNVSFNAGTGTSTIDTLVKDKADNRLFLDETNKQETFYSTIKGKMNRLTEFINKSFRNVKNKDLAETLAYSEFRKAGNPNPQPTDTIEHSDGKKYTFRELVDKYKKDFEDGRNIGNLSHLYMQYHSTKDETEKNRIYGKISLLLEGLPNSKSVKKRFEYLSKSEVAANIFRHFFIKNSAFNDSIDPSLEDRLVTELEMFDEDLGIGTTNDLIVEFQGDGELGLIDWKSGVNFFNDTRTQNILQGSNIPATKENVAKLELALRAFIIKKKMLEKGKDVKFKVIALAHLSEEYIDNVEQINVDMSEYLELIETHIRRTNPELHKKLKDKKLFKANSYGGQSGSLREELHDMASLSKEDKIKKIQMKINNIVLSIPEQKRTEKQNRNLAKWYQNIAELTKYGSEPLEDNVDIGWFKRNFGNWYSMTSSRMQNFGNLIMTAKARVRKEVQEIGKQHDKLLGEVYKQYAAEHGGFYTSTGGYIGTLKYKDLYDFLWEEKTIAEGKGYYMNIKNTYVKNGVTIPMTQAQINYRNFLKDTMSSLWTEVMSEPVFEKNKTSISKAKAANQQEKLPPDFMPRIPAEMMEYLMESDNKDKAQYLAYKSTQSYLESFKTKNGTSFAGAVPVKYMGGPVVVSQQLHTFSGEVAFKKFIENMVHKKHMDDLAALTDGIKNYYKMKQYLNPNEDWGNTLSFLEDHLLLDILDVKKELKLFRKPLRIPKNKYTIELGLAERPLAPEAFILGLKSAVSAGAMWLKLVPATFNAALIFLLNLKEAIKGSVGKLYGLDDQEIEYTVGDFVEAIGVWASLQFNSFIPNSNAAKLQAMSKEFGYLPDNYDYKAHPESLFAPRNRANTGLLFMFHKIGEDMGNYTILYATMKRMKTVDKQGNVISMWDAYQYDEKEDVLSYEGGVRGEIEITKGVTKELKGLEQEEITRLKRVSQKIHGGYRQEERIALELTALGSVVLQFRKFLPVIIENAFQGRYADNSLGFYKLKIDEQGNPVLKQGKNVYEWQTRMSEGRIMLLLKMISSYFRIGKLKFDEDDAYNWGNLKNEDKQNIRDLLITAIMIIGWLGIRGAAFDDDDEEKALYIRLNRLFIEDITQGYNPLDIIRSIQAQGALFYQAFDFMQGFVDFITEGVVSGKTTQEGNMPGLKRMRKRIPPFSIWYDAEKYFGDNRTGIGLWDADNL